MSQAEVARRLGISKPTVCYHARKLGIASDERFRRRYDWGVVQAFHDAGHGRIACTRHFGFSSETWNAAVRRGDLEPREFRIAMDALLAAPRSRAHLKRRILDAGLKQERCEVCGLTEWQGQRLAFELHHVNGDAQDNALENLQILCPNCHAQTDTWGGRNKVSAGARLGSGADDRGRR